MLISSEKEKIKWLLKIACLSVAVTLVQIRMLLHSASPFSVNDN